MELPAEVARLADAAERMLARAERRDREENDEELRRRWGTPLKHVGLATYFQAIPGLAAAFDRTVPPEFVAQTGDGEFTIACPCGEEPVVRSGELTGCGCERWFLHDGDVIHVALSPGSPVPAGEPEPNS